MGIEAETKEKQGKNQLSGGGELGGGTSGVEGPSSGGRVAGGTGSQVGVVVEKTSDEVVEASEAMAAGGDVKEDPKGDKGAGLAQGVEGGVGLSTPGISGANDPPGGEGKDSKTKVGKDRLGLGASGVTPMGPPKGDEISGGEQGPHGGLSGVGLRSEARAGGAKTVPQVRARDAEGVVAAGPQGGTGREGRSSSRSVSGTGAGGTTPDSLGAKAAPGGGNSKLQDEAKEAAPGHSGGGLEPPASFGGGERSGAGDPGAAVVPPGGGKSHLALGEEGTEAGGVAGENLPLESSGLEEGGEAGGGSAEAPHTFGGRGSSATSVAAEKETRPVVQRKETGGEVGGGETGFGAGNSEERAAGGGGTVSVEVNVMGVSGKQFVSENASRVYSKTDLEDGDGSDGASGGEEEVRPNGSGDLGAGVSRAEERGGSPAAEGGGGGYTLDSLSGSECVSDDVGPVAAADVGFAHLPTVEDSKVAAATSPRGKGKDLARMKKAKEKGQGEAEEEADEEEGKAEGGEEQIEYSQCTYENGGLVNCLKPGMAVQYLNLSCGNPEKGCCTTYYGQVLRVRQYSFDVGPKTNNGPHLGDFPRGRNLFQSAFHISSNVTVKRWQVLRFVAGALEELPAGLQGDVPLNFRDLEDGKTEDPIWPGSEAEQRQIMTSVLSNRKAASSGEQVSKHVSEGKAKKEKQSVACGVRRSNVSAGAEAPLSGGGEPVKSKTSKRRVKKGSAEARCEDQNLVDKDQFEAEKNRALEQMKEVFRREGVSKTMMEAHVLAYVENFLMVDVSGKRQPAAGCEEGEMGGDVKPPAVPLELLAARKKLLRNREAAVEEVSKVAASALAKASPMGEDLDDTGPSKPLHGVSCRGGVLRGVARDYRRDQYSRFKAGGLKAGYLSSCASKLSSYSKNVKEMQEREARMKVATASREDDEAVDRSFLFRVQKKAELLVSGLSNVVDYRFHRSNNNVSKTEDPGDNYKLQHKLPGLSDWELQQYQDLFARDGKEIERLVDNLMGEQYRSLLRMDPVQKNSVQEDATLDECYRGNMMSIAELHLLKEDTMAYRSQHGILYKWVVVNQAEALEDEFLDPLMELLCMSLGAFENCVHERFENLRLRLMPKGMQFQLMLRDKTKELGEANAFVNWLHLDFGENGSGGVTLRASFNIPRGLTLGTWVGDKVWSTGVIGGQEPAQRLIDSLDEVKNYPHPDCTVTGLDLNGMWTVYGCPRFCIPPMMNPNGVLEPAEENYRVSHLLSGLQYSMSEYTLDELARSRARGHIIVQNAKLIEDCTVGATQPIARGQEVVLEVTPWRHPDELLQLMKGKEAFPGVIVPDTNLVEAAKQVKVKVAAMNKFPSPDFLERRGREMDGWQREVEQKKKAEKQARAEGDGKERATDKERRQPRGGSGKEVATVAGPKPPPSQPQKTAAKVHRKGGGSSGRGIGAGFGRGSKSGAEGNAGSGVAAGGRPVAAGSNRKRQRGDGPAELPTRKKTKGEESKASPNRRIRSGTPVKRSRSKQDQAPQSGSLPATLNSDNGMQGLLLGGQQHEGGGGPFNSPLSPQMMASCFQFLQFMNAGGAAALQSMPLNMPGVLGANSGLAGSPHAGLPADHQKTAEKKTRRRLMKRKLIEEEASESDEDDKSVVAQGGGRKSSVMRDLIFKDDDDEDSDSCDEAGRDGIGCGNEGGGSSSICGNKNDIKRRLEAKHGAAILGDLDEDEENEESTESGEGGVPFEEQSSDQSSDCLSEEDDDEDCGLGKSKFIDGSAREDNGSTDDSRESEQEKSEEEDAQDDDFEEDQDQLDDSFPSSGLRTTGKRRKSRKR